ncbi:retrovirus-related pol polyprotein from transposon TNT 1-94 [Tanacetum coccineum]
MAKASPTQAWFFGIERLSHLNFDCITLLSKKDIVTGLPKLKYVKDQICSSCEMSKAKRSSFKSKAVPSSKGRLNLLHMDLCGPMRCPLLTDARVLEQDTYVYFKEKALSSDFHSSKLNRTALSKDETALLLRLLEQCSQLLSFHYHFLAEAVATASNGFTQNSLVSQGQKASYYDNSDPVPPRKNVVPRAEKTDLSHQGLEFPLQVLLLIEEYYTPSHNQAEENKQ